MMRDRAHDEAMDELFRYRQVEMLADVVAGNRLIATERLKLEPQKYEVANPARLGPYRYCASFYICRVGVDLKAWRGLEQKLREVAAQLPGNGPTHWGVSTLVAHGLLVRCLATHGSDVLPGLRAVWQAAKMFLYGRVAVPPRKVN